MLPDPLVATVGAAAGASCPSCVKVVPSKVKSPSSSSAMIARSMNDTDLCLFVLVRPVFKAVCDPDSLTELNDPSCLARTKLEPSVFLKNETVIVR